MSGEDEVGSAAAPGSRARTATPGAAETPTRRERQRAATLNEIVGSARQLLNADEDLSLRAVAQELGMTAPALYRYVDSHAGLIDLVTERIFADVTERMSAASAGQAADDPAARIIAATVCFRDWALQTPREFRMLLASTVRTAEEHAATAASNDLARCEPPDVGPSFGEYFAPLVVAVAERYPVRLPDVSNFDPRVIAAFHENPGKLAMLERLEGDSLAMVWLFNRAWSRLYGTLTLEVFGHIHPALVETGAIFVDALRDIGTDLGLADEMDRLADLARDLSASTFPARP